MKEYLNSILCGDAVEILRTLPAESVQMCVTSPPYYGLRDYGTAKWEGGDQACDHKKTSLYGSASTLRSDGRAHTGPYDGEKGATASVTPHKDTCGRCGAVRIDDQIGLERSPEEYVEKLVEVFREVRRVLRKDGTAWVNLGDSYATGAGKACSPGGGEQGERFLECGPSGYRGGHDISPKHAMKQVPDGKSPNANIPVYQPNRMPLPGLKPKDLIGIPWRVALALQADGWWLRSDIIWSKPNPMPESVTDRPTKAHEYLFLMSKSERYYYDADAIKEPVDKSQIGRVRTDQIGGKSWLERGQHSKGGTYFTNGKWSTEEPQSSGRRIVENVKRARALDAPHDNPFGTKRNRRSVWTVITEPFPEAHFATFPPKLIEPCILAGSSMGDTVLDPFMGSGTTAVVAKNLGRNFIGIDLNPEYVEMAERRIARECAQMNMFHGVSR